MDASLKFLGATQNVTGSRYLLQADGQRFLIDCGMHQERELRARDWDPFPVPPSSLDAVLITHAHLDHCGYLPRLVRDGFSGPVYCTPATAEIMRISLLDSANLQESDAEQKKKRHQREGRQGPYPEKPLYTVADAEACFSRFRPVHYETPTDIARGVTVSFHDAGHILGSAMIAADVRVNGASRRVVFSGDVGRWDRPILRDPSTFERADYVLVESTYGNRTHEDVETVDDQIEAVINSAVEQRGNIVVPTFAIERAQEVLYHMSELLRANRIPHILVFLDSPMAIRVTDVFRNHAELFDAEAQETVARYKSLFDFPSLMAVESSEHSKALNYFSGTGMIMAGSGMCTGGRIKHHLESNISRPESTILFVGYQAVGTLGRQIVDGAKEVRIFGEMHPVRARIEQVHGFSSHADRGELMRWLSAIRKAPRKVFVVHGEKESANDFAALIAEKRGWDVAIPGYRDEVRLD